MAGPVLQVGGLEGGCPKCNITYLSMMYFRCGPQMAGPVLPGLVLEDKLPGARHWIRMSGEVLWGTLMTSSVLTFR